MCFKRKHFIALTVFFLSVAALSGKVLSASEVRNGVYKWYFPSGGVKESHTYVNGKRNGETVYYYEDGSRKSVYQLVDEKFHGPASLYDNLGQLMTEKDYRAGAVVAERDFYTNGQLRREKNYINGKAGGAHRLFDKSGRPVIEVTFGNDREVFDAQLYDFDPLDTAPYTQFEYSSLLTDYFQLLFISERFDLLERYAESFYNERSVSEFGFWNISLLMGGIISNDIDIYYDRPESIVEKLERWEKQYPGSVWNKIATSSLYYNVAWDARGGGYANTISDDARDRYKQYINMSWEVLNGVYENYKQNYYFLRNYYMVSTLAKDGRGLKDKIFAEAVALEPAFQNIYLVKAAKLLPRWGGSVAAVNEFMADTLANTQGRLGHRLYAHIAGNVAAYVNEDVFKSYGMDWKKIHVGYSELNRDYPRNLSHLHRHAWFACHANDRGAAAELFKAIDGRWDDSLKYIWGDYAKFIQWRDWAASGSSVIGEMNAFHDLAKKGDIRALARFYQEDPEILHSYDAQGKTALHHAIESGRSNAAIFLIHLGADMKAYDDNQSLAIHLAAEMGRERVVQYLLLAGSPAGKRDKYSIPLMYAVKGGFGDIVRMLMPYSQGYANEALLRAVEKGHGNVIDELMQFDETDINFQRSEGNTALHVAARNGYVDAVDVLLYYGINRNILNDSGQSARGLAEENGFDEIVNLIDTAYLD